MLWTWLEPFIVQIAHQLRPFGASLQPPLQGLTPDGQKHNGGGWWLSSLFCSFQMKHIWTWYEKMYVTYMLIHWFEWCGMDCLHHMLQLRSYCYNMLYNFYMYTLWPRWIGWAKHPCSPGCQACRSPGPHVFRCFWRKTTKMKLDSNPGNVLGDSWNDFKSQCVFFVFFKWFLLFFFGYMLHDPFKKTLPFSSQFRLFDAVSYLQSPRGIGQVPPHRAVNKIHMRMKQNVR